MNSVWRRTGRLLWRLKFVYLQLAILIGAFWTLRPLRDAASLPYPPLPLYTPEPADLQETLVSGPTVYTPGTRGSTRVIVYDPRSGQGIPDALVRLALAPYDRIDDVRVVFEGWTNELGTVDIAFDVPTSLAGDWTLIVDSIGPVGEQRVLRPISLRAETALQLFAERTTYHPGEMVQVHLQVNDPLRGIALPEQTITTTVFDARNNAICREMVTTSQYGAAYAQCELARRVNLGTYRVVASSGDTTVQRDLLVEPPPQAAIRLQFHPDELYYIPGRSLTLTLHSTYPWGEPVAKADVELSGWLHAATSRQAFQAQGQTAEDGVFAFRIQPSAVSPAELGGKAEPATLRLMADVVDSEGRMGVEEWVVPVSEQPILMQVQLEGAPIWEGNALKPGLEQVIRVQANYPDGRPVECDVTLNGSGVDEPLSTHTDPRGWAEFPIRWPMSSGLLEGTEATTLSLVARDSYGQVGKEQVRMPVESGAYHVLLRPKQAAYLAGERIGVDLAVSHDDDSSFEPSALYVDAIRQGRPIAVVAAPLVDGKGSLELALPADIVGPLQLQAYVLVPRLLSAGGTAATSAVGDLAIVRDVRQITVRPPSALAIELHPDRTEYAPGDVAHIALRVADPQGQGKHSLLAIALWKDGTPFKVTEAMLAPADPTGAMLPLGWDHVRGGWDAPSPMGLLSADPMPIRAGTVSRPRPMPPEVRRAFQAVESIRAERRMALGHVADNLTWLLVALSTGLWLTAASTGWRDGSVRGHLRLLGRASLGGFIAVPLIAGTGALLAYLGWMLLGPGMALALGIGWLGGMAGLFAYAWAHRFASAQILLVGIVGHLALAWGVWYAVTQGAQLRAGAVSLALAAVAVVLFALHVFGCLAGSGWRGRALALLLAYLLVTTLVGTLIVDGRVTALAAVERDRQSDSIVNGPVEVGALGAGGLEVTDTPHQVTVHPRIGSPTPSDRPARETPDLLARSAPGQVVHWVSEMVTDSEGRAELEIPLDGSPGSWTLEAAALTPAGEWGVVQSTVETYDPLPIQISLPSALTVGDELDLPITLYNPLPVSQTVQITATEMPWYRVRFRELRSQEIHLPARRATQAYIPLRVTGWGAQTFEMAVHRENTTKTLSRQIQVLPDGRSIVRAFTGVVDAEYARKFRVPWSAVHDTERVLVKLYPNWASVLTEGLNNHLGAGDGLWEPFRLPRPLYMTGTSFEEGIARIRLNLLKRTYAELAGQATPETEAQTKRTVLLGYQELLTFESAEGGFSGSESRPADLVQTAFGLMCLGEVGRAYSIDPALTGRVVHWVLDRQSEEGAWHADVLLPGWENLSRPELPLTAYVAWALVEAGYGHIPELERAIEHLERYPDKAGDPYVLALMIHALAAYGAKVDGHPSVVLDAALAQLAEMAEVEGGLASWHTSLTTLSGAARVSGDPSSSVETTALATLALLRARAYPDLAAQGLAMLADSRDAYGTWGSPQATLLALQALYTAVAEGYVRRAVSNVRVSVDGIAADPVTLLSESADRSIILLFDQLSKGYNDVEIAVQGRGEATYEVVGTYFLPWDQVGPSSAGQEAIAVEVSYDRTEVEVGQAITATVQVSLTREGIARLAVIELGLPPGLEVGEDVWHNLVADQVVTRYERVGEYIRVYLSDLSAAQPVRFSYVLRAATPLSVKTLPTRAYDLANARLPAVLEPVQISVLQRDSS